jgi:methyl-accepting chemotaxis protein
MNLTQIRMTTGRFLIPYLWLHVPLIALAGVLIGTAWTMPSLGALILAAAATLNWRLAPESESTRYTISVALMGMVALLLYEFDGHPWQVDIHMYFFAALAMLTAFCDWRALLAGTVAVAVHHLLLNLIYPAAVFPGGGAFGRVVLHAVILLVESGVLIVVAMSLMKAFAQAQSALGEAQEAQRAVAAAAAEREQMAGDATRRRKADMLALAESFETSVLDVVETVSSSATEMQGTAQSMSQIARQASRQAGTVASAAAQASDNVQAVASAAEQLSSSISEISRQAAETVRASRAASEVAAETGVMVESLTAATDKIGQVVTLINDIASQTNLLALNATIEAARAGEAGKGFAVVAGEVKHLANQTGRATEEITGQIAAVQEGTSRVVAAIRNITSAIGDMTNISSGIASAVEQQGAATQEIARNVERASNGTHEVSANIGGVLQLAISTDSAVEDVNGAATGLARNAGLLRTEVLNFLANVRAG